MPEKIKEHTHHTPRVYLNRFAIDGMLMTERPGEAAKPLPVPEVGVRKRFYTVTTEEGAGSNEIEDALGLLEGNAGHAFRAIDEENLPLDTSTKVKLAEFLGHQMSRGIVYRTYRSEHIDTQEPWLRNHVEETYLKLAPIHLGAADPETLQAKATDYARDYDLTGLTDKNEVVRASVGTGQMLTNALVNMCWTFFGFERWPLLSSDQPVVCWLGPHRSSPWGPLAAAEVRVPISPTRALVASWHDQADTDRVIPGDALAAMSMNYHTAMQAADWIFWRPDSQPKRRMPLHDEPLSGPPPESSQRRKLTHELGEALFDGRAQTITVFTPPES